MHVRSCRGRLDATYVTRYFALLPIGDSASRTGCLRAPTTCSWPARRRPVSAAASGCSTAGAGAQAERAAPVSRARPLGRCPPAPLAGRASLAHWSSRRGLSLQPAQAEAGAAARRRPGRSLRGVATPHPVWRQPSPPPAACGRQPLAARPHRRRALPRRRRGHSLGRVVPPPCRARHPTAQAAPARRLALPRPGASCRRPLRRRPPRPCRPRPAHPRTKELAELRGRQRAALARELGRPDRPQRRPARRLRPLPLQHRRGKPPRRARAAADDRRRAARATHGAAHLSDELSGPTPPSPAPATPARRAAPSARRRGPGCRRSPPATGGRSAPGRRGTRAPAPRAAGGR